MMDNKGYVINYLALLEASYNKVLFAMEMYLQNILNAPSTINRILMYYNVGYNPDHPNKRYILFQNLVVQTYIIEVI